MKKNTVYSKSTLMPTNEKGLFRTEKALLGKSAVR